MESIRQQRRSNRLQSWALVVAVAGLALTVVTFVGADGWVKDEVREWWDLGQHQNSAEAPTGGTSEDRASEISPTEEATSAQAATAPTASSTEPARVHEEASEPTLSWHGAAVAWLFRTELRFWQALGHAVIVQAAVLLVTSLIVGLLVWGRRLPFLGIPFSVIVQTLLTTVAATWIAVRGYGGVGSVWMEVLVGAAAFVQSLIVALVFIVPLAIISGIRDPFNEVDERIEHIAAGMDRGRGKVFRRLTSSYSVATNLEVIQMVTDHKPEVLTELIEQASQVQQFLDRKPPVLLKYDDDQFGRTVERVEALQSFLQEALAERRKRDAAAAAEAEAKAKAEAEAEMRAQAEAKARDEAEANAEADRKARAAVEARAKEIAQAKDDVSARATEKFWVSVRPSDLARAREVVVSLQYGQTVRAALDNGPHYHKHFGERAGKYFFGQIDENGRPREETVWWTTAAELTSALLRDFFKPLPFTPSDRALQSVKDGSSESPLSQRTVIAASSRQQPRFRI